MEEAHQMEVIPWVRARAGGEEEMGTKSCKGSRNGEKAVVDLNYIYYALIKY